MDASSTEGRTATTLALAALVLLATLAFLVATRQAPPAALDTLRDYQLAHACDGWARCPGLGAPTSVDGLVQGSTWIRVLAAAERAALSPSGVQTVVFALQALAASVLLVAASRIGGLRSGVVAAAVFLPASVAGASGPNLWNPSIGPLPHALLALGLVGLASERQYAPFVTGIALGLSIDANLSSASATLPVLVFVFYVVCRRPALSSVRLFASAAAVVCLVSPAMVRQNFAFVSGRALWPLFGAIAATQLLAAWLRRRRKPRADVDQAVVALTALAVSGLVATWAVAPALGLRAEARYAAPYLAIGAVVVPVWLRRVTARSARATLAHEPRLKARAWVDGLFVLGCAPLAAVLQYDPRLACRSARCPNWSLDDVRSIGSALAARGWSSSALREHLRAPSSYALISALSAAAPGAGTSARGQSDLQLFMLGSDDARAFGADWERVPLSGGSVAAFRPLESYVDRDWVRACVAPESNDPGQPAFCVEVASPLAPRIADARPGYLGIAELGHLRHERLERGAPYHLRYELALRTPADGKPRVLETLDDGCDGVPWMIDRVVGIGYEGELPGRSVRLIGAPGAVGRIVLAKRFDERRRIWDRSWLPDLIETGVDEDGVRAALTGDACR